MEKTDSMNGFKIATIRQVDIRVNWSVLFVGWLITWSLATVVLPETSDSASDFVLWMVGAVTTAGFFVSLIAHELGHATEAQRDGVRVQSITLWLLGGVAMLEGKPSTPRAAFRIAAAGPVVSLVIGVAGLVSWSLVDSFSEIGGAAVGWLGTMNLILAVFNLIPAFPLDGGRIYQAWAWSRSGDADTATRGAARLGVVIGNAMMILGFAQAMFSSAVGGLWFIAIGWFLRDVARSELEQLELIGPLRAYSAKDVMTASPHTVEPAMSLLDLVAFVHATGRHASYPVMGSDGELLGMALVHDLAHIDAATWDSSTVSAMMVSVDQLLMVPPDMSIEDLGAAMNRRSEMRAIVVDDGGLLGLVAPSDIARLITSLSLGTSTSMPEDDVAGRR